MEVAASLDAQVYSLEMERALRKPGDITAWEAAMRSLAAYRKYDPADRERAIEEARRAVAIAPDYAPGHAMLADALAIGYFPDGPDDPAEVQRSRKRRKYRSLIPSNSPASTRLIPPRL